MEIVFEVQDDQAAALFIENSHKRVKRIVLM